MKLMLELIASLANFLRINIYLTQKISEDMLWNIAVNDPGADYDPLTLLRSRTMFGRPDWMSIYGRIKQAIETGQYIPGANAQLQTRVAVRDSKASAFSQNTYSLFQTYFCGPPSLAKDIKEATALHTTSTVKFSFAKVCLHLSFRACYFNSMSRNISETLSNKWGCIQSGFLRHLCSNLLFNLGNTYLEFVKVNNDKLAGMPLYAYHGITCCLFLKTFVC